VKASKKERMKETQKEIKKAKKAKMETKESDRIAMAQQEAVKQ
jgi:hypothetical protein